MVNRLLRGIESVFAPLWEPPQRAFRWKDPQILVLLLLIVIFAGLIFGPFFKPPWAEDQLSYALLSGTNTVSHFDYWNGTGMHSERLSVLNLIRVFALLTGDPASASTVLIVSVTFLLNTVICLWVFWTAGALAATLAGSFFVFTMIQFRAHATELLADPIATCLELHTNSLLHRPMLKKGISA